MGGRRVKKTAEQVFSDRPGSEAGSLGRSVKRNIENSERLFVISLK